MKFLVRRVSQHIHLANPGHSVSVNYNAIFDLETSWFAKGGKEAVYVYTRTPTNREVGRFNLSHISVIQYPVSLLINALVNRFKAAGYLFKDIVLYIK